MSDDHEDPVRLEKFRHECDENIFVGHAVGFEKLLNAIDPVSLNAVVDGAVEDELQDQEKQGREAEDDPDREVPSVACEKIVDVLVGFASLDFVVYLVAFLH